VPSARALAVAQTVPVRGDVDANVAEHVRLVAAREGARVIVFPELSLTGYELDLARDTAFSEKDPRLIPLLDLTSSCSMTVIVGEPVGGRMALPRRHAQLTPRNGGGYCRAR
jgi:predicted amidohydrolase